MQRSAETLATSGITEVLEFMVYVCIVLPNKSGSALAQLWFRMVQCGFGFSTVLSLRHTMLQRIYLTNNATQDCHPCYGPLRTQGSSPVTHSRNSLRNNKLCAKGLVFVLLCFCGG